MMNQLKKVMLFRLLILIILSKNDYDTIISEIEKKKLDPDCYKYITTQEFTKLMADNFAERLAQANLATEADIDGCLEKTNFDDKLKKLNKKSQLKKHVLAQNDLNELSEKNIY